MQALSGVKSRPASRNSLIILCTYQLARQREGRRVGNAHHREPAGKAGRALEDDDPISARAAGEPSRVALTPTLDQHLNHLPDHRRVRLPVDRLLRREQRRIASLKSRLPDERLGLFIIGPRLARESDDEIACYGDPGHEIARQRRDISSAAISRYCAFV